MCVSSRAGIVRRVGAVWVRSTTIIDDVPDGVVAAIERVAVGRGIAWAPQMATLVWATESTTEVGRIRTRTRTVRTVGVLAADVLAWTVSDDGGAPAAVVVRRSRVDVADGSVALSGLSPELRARAGPLDTDGVTVRGDLGGRDLASIFIPLGRGPAADRVRAALLA